MPTMVQQPEIASSGISNLQAIERPEGKGNLGSFLMDIAGAASSEVKKYQDENASKNIALGMNDQLNKVHREVSWLDRRNYEYGHQYQYVQNGQAALQKKFVDDVNGIESTDPEAANKVFDIGRQYMDSTVNNIHESNLPAALKESLYQSTMKENAIYQQMINKKLQQLTADAEYNTRLNMTAMLARDLRTKEFNAESVQLAVQTFKEKVAEGMRNSVVQVWDDSTQRFESKTPSAEDIQKEVSLRLQAAFTNTLDDLKSSGTAEDIERMQMLREVADILVDDDIELSTYIQSKATKFQAEVEANNDSYKSREVTQLISSWELNPESLTDDVLNSAIAKISNDQSLSIPARTQYINQMQNSYTSIKKAILASKVTDITLYDSPSQYEAIGKTEEAWAKDWVEHYQKLYQGDPNKAGYEIMLKSKGSEKGSPEYSSSLMKRGSEIFFRAMLGAVNMTDAEAAKDPYYGAREGHFSNASQLYRTYKLNNGSAAIDMLSGIDEKYRAAFEVVMENGGSLAQVREIFKQPVQITDSYKYYDTARDAITPELLGLRKEILGGTGGTRTRNMADSLETPYTDMVKEVLTSSKHAYVSNIKGTSPHQLLAAAKQDILLESKQGYSSIIMPTRARQAINNYKIEGTNTPLGNQYISNAIDAQREAIAKQYDVRPDNVIVRIDDNGQSAQFYAYKTEKTWGGIREGEYVLANGNKDGFMSGGIVSMARIKKSAEDAYRKDNSKGTYTKAMEQAGGTMVGRGMIIEYGTKKGQGVKLNSLYAQAMGGNIDLATKYFEHLNAYEGFVSRPTSTYDKNTGKESRVYGNGVTWASMNAATRKMFREAEGIPQRIVDLQGGFMNNYYKSMKITDDLTKVGVPVPTASAYPKQFEQSLMLVYDAGWHGGNGALYGSKKNGRSGIIEAMNAPNIDTAMKLLKNTSIYDRSASGSRNRRNKWYENALRSHFKATGKL